jgi:hypothetical protein
LKSNQQLLDEITAVMADTWLAACERRVIGTMPDGKLLVLDRREWVSVFGPAPADECRVFIHRAAALDVLLAIGTGQVAAAAMIAADGKLPATLNG